MSTSPHLEKSRSCPGAIIGNAEPPGAPPANRPFIYSCTSSCVMRTFGPLPVTNFKSQPSSRAKRRTDGLASTGFPISEVAGRGGFTSGVAAVM